LFEPKTSRYENDFENDALRQAEIFEEIVFCREELLEALLWTVYMYLTKKIVRNELESSILAWNNLLLNE